MTQCLGITEPCWMYLKEDTRQKWRYFSAALRYIGAYLVTRTGNTYVDMALSALTVIAVALVIDPQRSYSKMSPVFRKRNVRITIGLGSRSIAVLGTCLFIQACIASGAVVWTDQSLHSEKYFMGEMINLLAILVVLPFAAVKIFRDLNLGELIFRLPREGLIKMFVYKQIKAQHFLQLAFIEVATLLVCLFYVSIAAETAKTVIEVARIFT